MTYGVNHYKSVYDERNEYLTDDFVFEPDTLKKFMAACKDYGYKPNLNDKEYLSVYYRVIPTDEIFPLRFKGNNLFILKVKNPIVAFVAHTVLLNMHDELNDKYKLSDYDLIARLNLINEHYKVMKKGTYPAAETLFEHLLDEKINEQLKVNETLVALALKHGVKFESSREKAKDISGKFEYLKNLMQKNTDLFSGIAKNIVDANSVVVNDINVMKEEIKKVRKSALDTLSTTIVRVDVNKELLNNKLPEPGELRETSSTDHYFKLDLGAVTDLEDNSKILSSNIELKSWYETLLENIKKLLADIVNAIKETFGSKQTARFFKQNNATGSTEDQVGQEEKIHFKVS